MYVSCLGVERHHFPRQDAATRVDVRHLPGRWGGDFPFVLDKLGLCGGCFSVVLAGSEGWCAMLSMGGRAQCAKRGGIAPLFLLGSMLARRAPVAQAHRRPATRTPRGLGVPPPRPYRVWVDLGWLWVRMGGILVVVTCQHQVSQ